jgi:uncharacterized protein (TIGR00730 family)
MRLKRLAVYCGSASPADPIYISTARHVGITLAKAGISIVYGGGRLGLMGALADAALEAGGEVIGVIPTAMMNREVAHEGCTTLEVVANMHERKARFTELADGFITLPGGVGTMDELWEAISWAQLGYHGKPIGLLNVAGYYDGLIAFNAHMSETGFVRSDHKDIMICANGIEELLPLMQSYTPHRPIFSMKVSDL